MADDNLTEFEKQVTSFFAQDLVSQDVASFSFRNVWFYFYRETLIGIANLETDQLWLLDANIELPDNGFTSQHLITPKLTQEVIDDNAVKSKPILMNFLDLNKQATQQIFAQCSAAINQEMGIKE